jgi:hypothetical protein
MMAAQIAMTGVIATQMTPTGGLSHGATIGLLVVVCVFIAGHAWGWGPMVRSWRLSAGHSRFLCLNGQA